MLLGCSSISIAPVTIWSTQPGFQFPGTGCDGHGRTCALPLPTFQVVSAKCTSVVLLTGSQEVDGFNQCGPEHTRKGILYPSTVFCVKLYFRSRRSWVACTYCMSCLNSILLMWFQVICVYGRKVTEVGFSLGPLVIMGGLRT